MGRSEGTGLDIRSKALKGIALLKDWDNHAEPYLAAIAVDEYVTHLEGQRQDLQERNTELVEKIRILETIEREKSIAALCGGMAKQ